jgi:hypothetical protein
LLLAGKLTEQGKDKVEEQVGQAVRAITQHLDALKNGVVAAQQPADGRQALVNEHSAAHLHGAVSTSGLDSRARAHGVDWHTCSGVAAQMLARATTAAEQVHIGVLIAPA